MDHRQPDRNTISWIPHDWTLPPIVVRISRWIMGTVNRRLIRLVLLAVVVWNLAMIQHHISWALVMSRSSQCSNANASVTYVEDIPAIKVSFSNVTASVNTAVLCTVFPSRIFYLPLSPKCAMYREKPPLSLFALARNTANVSTEMATIYTDFHKHAPSDLEFGMYCEQTAVLRDFYHENTRWGNRDNILPILNAHYQAFDCARDIVRRLNWVGERYMSALESQSIHLTKLKKSDYTAMILPRMIGLGLDFYTMAIVRISTAIGNPHREALWSHIAEHVNHLAIMNSFCHQTTDFLESSIKNVTTAIEAIAAQNVIFAQRISQSTHSRDFFGKFSDLYFQKIRHQNIETETEHDFHINCINQGFERTRTLYQLNHTLSRSLQAVHAICLKPKAIYEHIERGDHIGTWIPAWLEMSDAWYEAAEEMNRTLTRVLNGKRIEKEKLKLLTNRG